MGQKIHPRSHRLGVIYGWKSKWFADRDFRRWLREDVSLRDFIMKKLAEARVENIEIERSGQGGDIAITIYTAKPGMVIGRGGSGIEDLKAALERRLLGGSARVKITINEVRQGALSAGVMAQTIAADLEKRIPFRRAVKQALEQIKRAVAKGAKVRVKGRLNGAEIARQETFSWGSVPLHTLRANIDYAQASAYTTFGVIGVAVWIYKGEVFAPPAARAETGWDGGSEVAAELKKITAK